MFIYIFKSCFPIQTTTLKFNNNGSITNIMFPADVQTIFIFSVWKVVVPYLKPFTHNTVTHWKSN